MSVSTRLESLLDENKIPYSVVTHETAYTAQGAAAPMQISGKELAKAGADLGVVMGCRLRGNQAKAVIEVDPIAGTKVTTAAAETGLVASTIPTLLVEGDNKPDLAHKIAQTIADAGGDLSFLVAQAVGRKYSAVFGFANEEDAKKAATLIQKSRRK